MSNLPTIPSEQDLHWGEPKGRRHFKEWQWESLKWAVDEIRNHVYNGEATDVLREMGLWDEGHHYLDEERLTKLYMEYA